MNITEKIIAKHAGRKRVTPGEIVEVNVDYCMANDATIQLEIDIFENKFGFKKVFDTERVIFIHDHQMPADSVNTATVLQKSRKFAKKYNFKVHESDGVCHQVMLENYVLPGHLIVGADSHTCSYGCIGVFSTGMGSTDITAVMGTGKTWLKVPETIKFELNGTLQKGVFAKDVILKVIKDLTASGATYKTMEFSGSVIDSLTVGERFTICNMVIEAGGKSAMIRPDGKVKTIYKDKNIDWEIFTPDPDASYAKILKYELSGLKPQVACPNRVDNVVDIDVVEGTPIDQAFLGACTNGRIEDLRIGAKLLVNKKVNSNTRLLVVPASINVYRQAIQEGLIETFIDAGAIIMHPNCSTCWGACQGVLASGETLITSANRNFKGRAGSPNSKVYLASPATVVQSAIEGKITSPVEFC